MALREINLIPADILQKKYLLRHLFFWFGCLVLCLFMIFGFYLYQVHIVLRQNQPAVTLDVMDKQLAAILEEINEAQQENQRLSLQQSFLKSLTGIQPFSRILLKLSEIMNTRTWLTELTIKSNTEEGIVPKIELLGDSLSNDDLGNFLTQISGESMFNNVILKYAKDIRVSNSRQDKSGYANIVQFQIDCEVPGS